ncbi:MAG: hypothetical protein WC516_04920 [Patescibacteria group bacterium]|jgi:hypothetical protein
MAKTKTYRYAGATITAPMNMSNEDVRKIWMEIYPSLVNAKAVERKDGTVEFIVQSSIED